MKKILGALVLLGAGVCLSACGLTTSATLPSGGSGATIGGSVSVGGAPPTAPSTGGSAQNWQMIVSITRTGVGLAEAAETTICATPSAPAFCSNAADQAKIVALEADVNDTLGKLSDALTAYQAGGSQTALALAMGAVTQALADYNATVAAFRSGKT